MRGPRRVERIGVLAFAWVWWSGVATAREAAVQEAQEPEATAGCEATIVAHVSNYAALEPGELAAAEREAARIYETIRVRILWVPGPEPPPDPDQCGFPLRVLLLSRAMVSQLGRTHTL